MAEAREGAERAARAGGGGSLRIRLRDMAQRGDEGSDGRKKNRGVQKREEKSSERVVRASVALGGRRGDGGRCRGRFCGLQRARGLLGTASSCCGGCREHKGGRWRELRTYFVLLDLAHIGTLPNSETRSTPPPLRFLADEPRSHPAQRRPATSYSTPVLHSRSLRLVGIEHQLWPHFLVKLLWRQIPECHRRRLQCRSLFVCLLGAPRDV